VVLIFLSVSHIGIHFYRKHQSAFYNSLVVVVVPLLDYVLLGREMRKKVIVAIMLAILGVMFMQQTYSYDQLNKNTSTLGLDTTTIPVAHIRIEDSNSDMGATTFPTMYRIISIGDMLCLLQALFFGIGY
jgi:drug/metabolite transporter (DMT)-like permease